MSEKNEPPYPCDSWNKTTRGTEVEKTFVWTMANFRNYHFRDKEMLSTIFTLPGPEECVTKWQLEFYPAVPSIVLKHPLSSSDSAVPSIVLKCLSNNVRAIPMIGDYTSDSCEMSSSGTLRIWTWNYNYSRKTQKDLNIRVKLKMYSIEKTEVEFNKKALKDETSILSHCAELCQDLGNTFMNQGKVSKKNKKKSREFSLSPQFPTYFIVYFVKQRVK